MMRRTGMRFTLLALAIALALPAGTALAKSDEADRMAERAGQGKKGGHAAAGIMNVINVKDTAYGAKGDGATADTAAIQRALDAAAAAGGGTVYFPKGTYVTDKDLLVSSNTKLVGDQAKIAKKNAADYAVFAVGAGQRNIEFDGLWIENNKTSGSIGIDLGADSGHVRIVGSTFTGRWAQAVNANSTGVRHILVEGNRFEGVNYGVLTNFMATDIEDVRIIGNAFLDIYSDAVELNHPGAAYTAGSNIIVANNYIRVPSYPGAEATGGFGIGIAGATHVSITGNVIVDARYEAIHIEDEAKHISIVGNVINGVGNSPDVQLNSGIYVIDGDYITISGNTIDRAHDYGIHLEYSTDTQATNTAVTGNTVTRSGGGIKASGQGASDVVISDNVATSNTGHGVHLVGSLPNLKVTSNISRDNGGYGMYIDGSGSAWHIAGNSFHGNTAGDIGYGAGYKAAMPLKSRAAAMSGTVAGQYTPWLDAFPLGKGAEGLLYVTATRDHADARATVLYKLSWNGTALTVTPLADDSYGTLGLDTPKADGDRLQVRAYSVSADGTTVDFDVQFEGLMLLK
ncbi:right-handed parallel beta-helix repeat-containing protein [Paenibacillus flagellatus]|uniref:Pectate lyase superfamily protein domain-containing protein n=1 Tax=Paenibacillus flagellatus TaxID=2211139 RepID=A0A2V5K103_9BACL|nr:right-handed parallel beta-helix repeat-containing protein [Paenibacillus flagellatus]PYI52865.1 hypothetical protein DLM86_17805 [Paenibacillus flagellatus]